MDVNHEIAGAFAPFCRDRLLEVYRQIRAALASGHGPTGPTDWQWLGAEGPAGWPLEAAARVFEELGLLIAQDRAPWLTLAPRRERTDLKQSFIYRQLTNWLPEV